jgi:hypothetical protein
MTKPGGRRRTTGAAIWCMGLLAVLVASAGVALAGQRAFPGRLDAYFTKGLGLTAAERQALLDGQPVVKMLPGDKTKEVGVAGAIWIGVPVAAYVAAVQDIERLERGGGIRVTKKVGTPARVEDFAALKLPPDDVKDLRSCKIGDCDVKLGEASLVRIRSQVDWNASDATARVESLMRQLAVDYVNAYREGGNQRLAVYRDNEHPTFVAREFEELISGMPELVDYLPDVRRALLDYPKQTVEPTASFIYWQEADFGLKPVIRINHVTVHESSTGGAAVTSKQLYASHYFWTALELRVLVPDPSRGTGFWFVNINRSRSDGLSGFLGAIVRGKVREGARSGLESVLVSTKKLLEHR